MAQETQEIDVRALLMRMLKNWYWFVVSFILSGAFCAYQYLSQNPKFTVDASIMIRSSEENGLSMDMSVLSMMGMGNTKQIEDEIEILTSRDILSQVIDDLDLQTEYRKKDHLRWVVQYPKHDLTINYPTAFLDTMRKNTHISVKKRKRDYVVTVKYGKWDTSRHRVTDITQPITTSAGELSFSAATNLEKGDHFQMLTRPKLVACNYYKQIITAAPVKKESNIIHIQTTTDIPRRAIDFITKEIDLYNLDAVVDKNIIATNTAAFIEERLRLIQEELSTAEIEVEKYKEKYGIVDLPSEAELFLIEGAEYKKRVNEIETQLNLVQYVGEFVADDKKQNSLIPANLGISDMALVELISEYNQLLLQRMKVQRTAADNNPVIVQWNNQLALLRENIISSIASVRQSLMISKQDLDNYVSQVKHQRNDIPSQEREYIRIERQRQLKEALYLFLYEKREENALTLASSVVPAKIIAIPQMDPTPVSPRLKILAVLCMIMTLGFPTGIIFLHDFFNNKISDDSRVYQNLVKLPFGGILVKNHHGEHVAVRNNVNSVSAELFRTLRTNIRFMIPQAVSTPVFLVTSSINGEGKSYVATNLAISLSLLNKKVALVGLDIRKPMLAQYMNLPSVGCLTSYLSDNTYSVDDLVVKSEFENLDILPAGVIPPNPSELLLSKRLDELFEELRKRYDYVIIDSAPVAMVSDTFQLARVSDMTVYVSKANYTTTNLLDFLKEVHQDKRLPNIVTVLNGVNPSSCGYGYGYGYGSTQEAQKKKWWQKNKA